MKKIKLFITVVLCAFCLCFAFAGCAADGAYIEGSFKVSHTYYSSYSQKLTVDAEFEVKLEQAGEYTVEYELCQISSYGNVFARKACSNTITKSAETNKTEFTVSVYESITTSNTSETVKIENVKITLAEAKPDYYGYAIGFGLVGALLLGGLVAVFVLDKLGKLNELNILK